jgi:thioredoxin 2
MSKIVVCPHCQTLNKTSSDRDAKAAKCGHCHEPIFAGHPFAVNERAFNRHIYKNEIPVVVDFWASWCGPCKMIEPVFAALSAEMEPSWRFLRVDTEAERSLSEKFQIRSIPMLIVFRKGEIVSQKAGVMDKLAMRNWLVGA